MRRAYLFCLLDFSRKLFVSDSLQRRASAKPLETKNFPAKYRGGRGEGGTQSWLGGRIPVLAPEKPVNSEGTPPMLTIFVCSKTSHHLGKKMRSQAFCGAANGDSGLRPE
jgi:hypothetical protein